MKQINARQLARELNIRGWTCVRSNGGSHSQYRNPSSPKVITLAGHGARPIPPGLLRKILRDAGIDPDAFAYIMTAVVSTRGEPKFVREQDIDPFFQEPNATHLRRAIADMEAGRNIVEHDLIKA